MIGDKIHQRKYIVQIGYTLDPATVEQLPVEFIACDDVDNETYYIVPLEEIPVTLTYTPRKAVAVDRDSEQGLVEAQDLAMKKWRDKHPDQPQPTLIGFDAKWQWERLIVDQFGVQ